jgi:hypothetical protein
VILLDVPIAVFDGLAIGVAAAIGTHLIIPNQLANGLLACQLGRVPSPMTLPEIKPTSPAK